MMTIYGFGTIRSQMTGPAARKRPCAATARGKHLLCTGGNRRSAATARGKHLLCTGGNRRSAATARAKTLSRAGRSNCSAGRVRQGICAVWPMRGPRVHPGIGSKASPMLFRPRTAPHRPALAQTARHRPGKTSALHGRAGTVALPGRKSTEPRRLSAIITQDGSPPVPAARYPRGGAAPQTRCRPPLYTRRRAQRADRRPWPSRPARGPRP